MIESFCWRDFAFINPFGLFHVENSIIQEKRDVSDAAIFFFHIEQLPEHDSEAQHLDLTDFEYAFYAAVSNNESARELMQQEKLRELAVVLTERIRLNASIDWIIKESVKAKLKVAVKRILRKFDYPPDMQMLATETVLKQAELIANELAN